MQAALKSLEEIAAAQTDPQESFRIRGVMSLLATLQKEWDTCASSRVAAIARYTGVIRDGARLTTGEREEELRRILLTVDEAASDLRISSLETTLDQLRGAVIGLQSWAEDAEGPGIQELRTAIWQAEYEDAKNEDRNRSFW
jgi:hypothetical protein